MEEAELEIRTNFVYESTSNILYFVPKKKKKKRKETYSNISLTFAANGTQVYRVSIYRHFQRIPSRSPFDGTPPL